MMDVRVNLKFGHNRVIRIPVQVQKHSQNILKVMIFFLECPATHPFAYLSGEYCCRTSKEKMHTAHGEKCDGSMIGFDSTCCENDDHADCPTKGKVLNRKIT